MFDIYNQSGHIMFMNNNQTKQQYAQKTARQRLYNHRYGIDCNTGDNGFFSLVGVFKCY
jgi:hypothetical protein